MKCRGTRYNRKMARGDYEPLDGNWVHTSAACACAGKVFAVDSARLWAIDVAGGSWAEMPGTWDTKALVACGDDALFAFEQSGALYRVAVADGTWEELEQRTWLHLAAAAGGTRGDAVYAIDGPTLWAVRRDGDYAPRGEAAWDPLAMVASAGDALSVFERSGELYRVDGATGSAANLGGAWVGTTAACAVGDRVYAVANEMLYEVDPRTGERDLINTGWRTRHLAGLPGALYAFEESGSLFRIEV